jgi:hypothetical protein
MWQTRAAVQTASEIIHKRQRSHITLKKILRLRKVQAFFISPIDEKALTAPLNPEAFRM